MNQQTFKYATKRPQQRPDQVWDRQAPQAQLAQMGKYESPVQEKKRQGKDASGKEVEEVSESISQWSKYNHLIQDKKIRQEDEEDAFIEGELTFANPQKA